MDLSSRRKFSLFLVLLTVSAIATAASAPPLVNWSAPKSYTPTSGSKIRALGDIVGPVPYVPVTPCRQYSSVGTPLLQGVNRAVTLTGAPCGILTSAIAISVNITVFNISGATGNAVFKVDTVSPPFIAWINYPPTEIQRGNAGIVALNLSGQIIVQVAQGAGQVDFVVDVNGYYPNLNSANLLNPGEHFEIAVSNPPPFAAINGRNNNATDGAIGILGIAGATTGAVYGIEGTLSGSTTSGAAAVVGIDGGPPNANYLSNVTAESGVAALVNGSLAYGVLGISPYIAAKFFCLNSGGTQLSIAYLGEASDAARFFGNVSINAFGAMAGNLSVAGTLSKGAGAFKIDHPLDPENKYLYHSFVESPDMMNIYNGNVVLDRSGEATVELPDYFQALNMDFRYQLTSIGRFSAVYVADEIQSNQFRIAGGRPGAKVSWQVTGIRHDKFAEAHRIPTAVEKEEAAKGFYVHPAEFGKGPEMDLAPRAHRAAAQAKDESKDNR